MEVILGKPASEIAENEPIIAVEYIGRLASHLILSGSSGIWFDIVERNQENEGKLIFYKNNDGLKFFYAADLPSGAEAGITFKTGASSASIKIPIPAAISGFADQPDSEHLWDALTTLGVLSPDWHLALTTIAPERIMAMPVKGRNFQEREIIQQLKAIFSKWDPAEWIGSIDGFDSEKITGWAKHQSSNKPAPVDILVNDVAVRKDFIPAKFRQDLKDAHIGEGNHSFELMLDEHAFDSDILAVALADPETGNIFAFKVLAYDYGNLEYNLNIDEITPVLTGSCYTSDWPGRKLQLNVFIDDVFFSSCWNTETSEDLLEITGGMGAFKLPLPVKLLSPGKHTLRVEIHGGRHKSEHEFENTPPLPALLPDLACLERRISIIIPWYNDRCLEECISRVLQYTTGDYRVFVVNDCSTLEDAQAILERVGRQPRVTVLQNPQNMGFSRTVNNGLVAAGADDVVILNQDAFVTPGWLKSMLLTAASTPKTATVTPMSNRAGAFSAPEIGNDNILPAGASEEEFALAFRRASFGLKPVVPTGNGFCMYISRACINDIGLLDADRYAVMYGEENDFCMRAMRNGWFNLVDDSTYVFHERPVSFTPKRKALMDRAAELLSDLYPEYKQAARIFGSGKDFQMARFAARLACRHWPALSRRRIMYVISVEGGGTPQTNADLMEEMDAQCYLLICNSRWLQLKELKNGKLEPVYSYKLEKPIEPFSHVSNEYDSVVASWINKLDIDIVHIRLILWHSLNLIPLAKRLGCKVVFSLHDFYTISPNLYLIDDAGNFLGDDYLPTPSPWRKNLWEGASREGLPCHSPAYIKSWQNRMEHYLCQCDALVTTSDYTKNIFLETFKQLNPEKFLVIPHGRSFAKMLNLRQPWTPGQRLKILLPGNLDDNKGRLLIESLVEYDAKHLNMLEFHNLGNYYGHVEAIKQHGWYKRKDFAKKVAEIGPHTAVIFSVWSETWCHTLTECWSIGLPAFVLDFGTQAERVRKSGAGWVLPYSDIPEIYENLIRIATDIEEQAKAGIAVAKWQRGEGTANNSRTMALKYYNLYRNLLKNRPPAYKAEQSKHVALCTHRNLATSHLRLLSPCKNDFNREVTYHLISAGQLATVIESINLDHIVIQRNNFDKNTLAHSLKLATQKNIAITFEIDDDLLQIGSDHDRDKEYEAYKPFINEIIAASDQVIVSTSSLAEKFKHKIAHLRKTRLPRDIWTRLPYNRKPIDSFRALYHATKTHVDDFMMILPALKQISQRYPEFTLRLVGLGDILDPEITELTFIENGDPEDRDKAYANYTNYLYSMSGDFDLGLAPLEDSAYNSAKSYLKVLEYGALGLPTLASNAGPYKEATHIPHLTLCDNTVESWVTALEQAILLGRQNRINGRETYAYVQANYISGQSEYDEFDKIINNAN